MIRPGLITQAGADEINQMLANQGTSALWSAGPVGTTRSTNGITSTMPNDPGECWAKLLAVTNNAWTWEQWYESFPGTWGRQIAGYSGTLNAYPATDFPGFSTSPALALPNAYVGQIVRMYRSRSYVDTWEFSPLPRAKVHGILQNNLVNGGSADLLLCVFAGSSEQYIFPVASVTVWGFLLPTNFTVFQGEYVSAFYDVWSQRWYADGFFNRNPVLANLTSDLVQFGTATAAISPGSVSSGGMSITVHDAFLPTGYTIPAGSNVLAFLSVLYENNPITPGAATGTWYAIGNATIAGGISGLFTVKDGAGVNQIVTVTHGQITNWTT